MKFVDTPLMRESGPRAHDDSLVNHPAHYGGVDDPFEAIKIIEHYKLGFCLGNLLKYVLRAGRKPGSNRITDLRKAAWYLDREIRRLTVEGWAERPLGTSGVDMSDE
jgi:hypothetical protein